MHRYTLEELGLVDADPEPAFTGLAELAADLLEAPVSLVSFVQFDKDRQFFKARVGLDREQTSLSRSFCRQVVSTGEPLEVTNSLEDPRVRNNPVIGELGVHAYLGVPVLAPDGEPVASLCVINDRPRRWSGRDRERLERLAECVTAAIRLKVEVLDGERLRREQRDLIHAISDKVKEPLRSSAWAFEELEEGHGAALGEEGRRLATVARGAMDRARRTVDDLLRVGEVIERAEFESGPVDLGEALVRAMEHLAPDVERLDARVDIAAPLPTVPGDRFQIDLLLRSLLDNALRFHRAGVPPRVWVSSRECADVVELDIMDRGIGIASKYRSKAFELFERVHPAGYHEGGGTGLALACRVVRNHGGSVRIRSDGRSGTTVTVRLPRQPSETSKTAPASIWLADGSHGTDTRRAA